MSTLGSVALIYKDTNGVDMARIRRINGSDMMYSHRGKSICQTLDKMVNDINYSDNTQFQRAFDCLCEYLNYQYFVWRDKVLKQQYLNTTIYDYLPITYLSRVVDIPAFKVGVFMGDASNWTYIKNITKEPVKLCVCDKNSDTPNMLYSLEPNSVCVLEWGALPKNNPYNKNLKKLGPLKQLPDNIF